MKGAWTAEEASVNDVPTYSEHIHQISNIWEATKFWLTIAGISIGALLGTIGLFLGYIWRKQDRKISEAYNNSLAALDNDTDHERRFAVIEKELNRMATQEGLNDLKELLRERTDSIMEFIKENTKIARQQFGIVQEAERELVKKYISRAEKAERRLELLEKKNLSLEKELEKKK